ncbi:hypothetical protein PGTUg99_032701 [Puccinia graminis f. sp. tritici]|uniref:Alpha-ketoglutarate-dependent dioxygenase AlkB-like domain-containing protein n=1 Tax=Puccinia graminis f. sp. tritici TaxID=56615 RepID=A0A5B0LTY6_PUCGR|nr:hypothetical protein PGTUg99_032701 [Puccinia graminis f. sp. tritici]
MAQAVMKTLRACSRASMPARPSCSVTIGIIAPSCAASQGPSSWNASSIGIPARRNLSSQSYDLRDETCEWFEIPDGHSEYHKDLYKPTDFVLHPRFLTGQEQDLILDHSLTRLDKMERPRARRRGGAQRVGGTEPTRETSRFRAEEEYSFEAGHFDQVISGYREMQLGQFVSPSDTTPTHQSLASILARLQALLPDAPRPPLIHLLHLSSQGRIDPHVDNLEASGSTIVGLSLGSTRVMRLGHQAAPILTHLKVLLPPGSVYIQRDSVRYNLQHSIPIHDSFKNQPIIGAQRLSIMLRNQH